MTQLNENTTSLQEILEAVNNLPEAGGGGGALETCQVTITSNGRAQISYASELTEAGKHRAETFTGTRTLTVVKNTTIFFSTVPSLSDVFKYSFLCIYNCLCKGLCFLIRGIKHMKGKSCSSLFAYSGQFCKLLYKYFKWWYKVFH